MIAEDELLVRVGLKTSVEWARFGMSVVGEASNGETAWKMYSELQPHIVLTDIKMPKLNGLELIRRIRKTDKKTKIVMRVRHVM